MNNLFISLKMLRLKLKLKQIIFEYWRRFRLFLKYFPISECNPIIASFLYTLMDVKLHILTVFVVAQKFYYHLILCLDFIIQAEDIHK